MSPPPTSPPPRRAAFAFVFVTVLLDMLALGAIVPVLPGLIASFYGGDVSWAARVYGLFGTVFALMQFVASPVLGALSDRVGRRPVILLSNLGLGLDYILMALAPTVLWLFVGRVISGITAASVSTAFAYIADSTPPERRARAFGLIGAAFGVGFVVGPALGGYFGSFDPRLPFWIAAALSLLNAAYGFFVLPESLPPGQRTAFRWRKANPLGSLTFLRAHRALLGLGSVSFLGSLAHGVLPSVFVLYAGHRHGWDERVIGLTLAGVGACSMVVQGGLVGPAVRRFGEVRTLLVGLSCGALGMAIYGLAPSERVFWIGVPVMALWGLAGPSTQALMSRRVSPGAQGQLQGANGSLMGLANLISPWLFTGVFALFISERAPLQLPGAPFLLAAALLLLAAGVAAVAVRRAGPAAGAGVQPHEGAPAASR